MTWSAWASIVLMVVSVAAMARGVAPDLTLTAAMGCLLLLGILTPSQAAEGFGNEGMLTVAVLFVVAAGIESTGAMDWVVRRVLGRPRSTPAAQARMMFPVALMSAFLNNTPVVAMMLPIVQDWAKRIGVSPAKLLMPLSWATILGGTITIIGTSTNLVVTGLASKRFPGMTWNLFEITPIGLLVAAAGLVYILVLSRWLLPDRSGGAPDLANARDYSVAFRVAADAPIIGATIEGAGLRHLPGLYLVEIERGGETMAAVEPDTRLQGGDVLVFVGLLESVVDLRKIRGLVPAAEDQIRKIDGPSTRRRLVEAVVAQGSPLAGKSVRDAAFRTHYRAAIIAVHRNGERLGGKIGDIHLRAGDTLLLECQPAFLAAYRNDRSFALVSEVTRSTPIRHERGGIAVALLVAMIAANALGWVNLFTAGLACAGAMLAARCLTGAEARRALELNVLLAIAASFSVGKALEITGAAQVLGEGLVHLTAPLGRFGTLGGVYLAVMILTELITNNAAAALLFPVAIASAEAAGIPAKAMCYVVMFAASASFMTPIGYQTNLMVYGPGGYRFSDFVRFGAPLQLLLAAITVVAIYALHVR
ncbi:MAG: SLC13 family permease [Candidatus Binatia bacterium]